MSGHPYFPERGESQARARATCLACPVRAECLAYALHHSIDEGIWGGTGVRDRQRLRRLIAATTEAA